MDDPPPPIPRFKVNTPEGQVAFDNLSEYLAYLGRHIAGNKVQPGVGVRIDRTPQGTIVQATPTRAVGRSTGCPFNAQVSGGVFRFTRLGLVNGGLPVNMFEGDELWSVEVTSGALGFILLNVTTDGNVVTSATIATSSTPADPPGILEEVAPAGFSITLYAVVNYTAIRAWGCGNVRATPTVALTTQNSAVACGANPDVRHYTWGLSIDN